MSSTSWAETLTIADWLKYREAVMIRLSKLDELVSKTEAVKTKTVINPINNGTSTATQQTETTTEPTLRLSEVIWERDKTAKELRLLTQAIERANHTVILDFNTSLNI